MIARFNFILKVFAGVFVVALASAIAEATPLSFNVDGVITKPDGTPLEDPTVAFTIEIRSPVASGSCLLYQENKAVSMTGSGGYFSIPIGKGTNVAPGGYTLDKVLGNEATLTSLSGCGGTYAPGVDDDRQVLISFSDLAGTHNFATQDIKAVPFAIRSKTAQTVGGFGAAGLIKVDSAVSQSTHANTALTQTQYDEFWRLVKNPMSAVQISATTTQAHVDSIFSRYSILDTLLNGTYAGNAATATALASAPGACPGGQYISAMTASGTITCGAPATSSGTVTNVTSANSYLSIATGSTTPVLTLNIGTTANTVAAGNDSRFTDARAPSGVAGGDLSGTYPNPTVSKIAGKAVILTSPSIGEVLRFDGTNFVNGSTADTSKLPLAGGTMSGAIDMGSQNLINTGFITMSPAKSLHLSNNASDPAGLAPGDQGKVWYNSTSREIKYWNGSGAVALGTAGSGLLNLNGQTGTNQTFAFGTSGTTPGWTSLSNIHTLNIPLASTSAVAAGLISKTDYDNFNSKLGPSNSSGGDVSGVFGNISVDKIKGKNVVPGSYLTGQVLRFDGSNWSNAPLAFSDLASRPTTLAGYGITDGASNTLFDGKIFVGNGSNVATPVTLSGDATLSNTGVLTLGVVPIEKGGTGRGTVSSNGIAVGNTGGTGYNFLNCLTGQTISFDGTGIPMCVNSQASFLNGGNSFGATATLGTTDGFDLRFKTNNSDRVTIAPSGQVGIGNTAPAALLDLGANGSLAGTLRLAGASSGSVQLQPALSGGAWTMTLPTSAGSAGYVLSTNGAGITSWVAQSAGGTGTVTNITAGTGLNVGTGPNGFITNTGTLNIDVGTTASKIVQLTAAAKYPAVDGSLITNLSASNLIGTIPITNGGTGQTTKPAAFDALSPNTTKGDITVHNGTNNVRFPASATNNYVLTSDTTQPNGLKWAAVDGANIPNINAANITTGTLPVSRGGTNATSMSANSLIGSDGTGSAYVPFTCAVGEHVTFNAGGIASCGNMTNGIAIVKGGNRFAGPLSIGTADNNEFALMTNTTARMTISNDGRVGVNAPPDVASQFYVDSTANTTYSTAVFKGAGSASAPTMVVNNTNAATFTMAARFLSSSPTTAFFQTNVGIGVSNPAFSLDAIGTVKASNVIKMGVVETPSSSYNIDIGKSFSRITLNQSATVNFPAVPSTPTDAMYEFTLKVTQGAGGPYSITWTPTLATLKWSGGTTPSLPVTGKSAIYRFVYFSGDNIWHGSVLWQE